MKRKKPSFDESYYGYRSFTHLLEDADNLALVDIERNPKSGTYVVTGFSGERDRKAHRGQPGTNNATAPPVVDAAKRLDARPSRGLPPPQALRIVFPWEIIKPVSLKPHRARFRQEKPPCSLLKNPIVPFQTSTAGGRHRHSLHPRGRAITLALLTVCVIGVPARAADEPQNETLAKNKLKALGSLEVLEDEGEFKTKLTEAQRLLTQLKHSMLQQQGTMSPQQYQKALQGMRDEVNQMRSQINQANQQMNSLPRFRGRLASSYAQEAYNELTAYRNTLQMQVNQESAWLNQLQSQKADPKAKEKIDAEVNDRRDSYHQALQDLRTAG